MSKRLTLKRLKGKDLIDALFRKGNKILSKNLMLKVLESPKGDKTLRIGVSVPKRNFRRAVDRNRIKRQLRVVFKEVQEKVTVFGACMLIYRGHKKALTSELIEEARGMFDK
tara:strand:- start:1734 stop:2069 length:336 start_codon:yes stop_codon:yes gene_type:complete